MKKYIHFSLWNIEEIEMVLRDMELQGYRLVGVKSSHWFYFKKSAPKDAKYIITYNLARDNRKGMHEWQGKLLSEYNAQEIPCMNCDYHLYRITKAAELMDFENERCEYIKHAIFQHLLMISLFIIAASFGFVATLLGSKGIYSMLFFGILLFVTLSVFLYVLFGYRKQCRKVRKIDQTKQS